MTKQTNAISYTDSYINIAILTFPSANFLCLIASCQFIIRGKRICYVVQFVGLLMKKHKLVHCNYSFYFLDDIVDFA